jgi:hypothetical protein
MRSRAKSWAAAGVGVAVLAGVVVGLAAPAGAKGVASLTITGPGIPLSSPIEVSGRTSPDEWEDIFTSSGIQQALPDVGASGLAPKLGTEHLGPRHTLTWQVMTGPDEMTPIRQDLYLHADSGPLTYTAPGQPIWDDVTRGGWYRAPDRLRQALADACVPIIGDSDASTVCWERRWAAKAAFAVSTASAAKARRVVLEAEPDSSWPAAVIGLTAAAAFGSLGGAVAVRRSRQRRRRMASISL